MTTKCSKLSQEEGAGGTRYFLQTVIDGIPDQVMVVERDYRIVLANQAVRKTMGGTDPVSKDMLCYQVSHHRDSPCEEFEHPCPLKKVFATGKPVIVTHTHYDTGGNRIFVEINASPILDDSGKVTHVIEVLRDITAHRQAEEAVAKSVKLWQTTFNGITDAVCLLDNDAKILLCNQSTDRMFEKAHDQIIGHSCCEIVHGSPIHLDGCPLVRMRSSLKREELELSIGDKWFQVIVDPITDDDGKLTGTVHIVSDITERKQAEEEREKLLKILSAKNAELQSIVYIASHDLRSPLVNVAGFGDELTINCNRLKELLRDAVFDEDKVKQADSIINEFIPESLRFINASTKKMYMLLEGMLQVSCIGTAEVNIDRLDMNKILSNVIETFQFETKECGAIITIDKLPGCLGDNDMINQIFSNLIDNALKYLDKGRKGKIYISGRTDGQMNIYCVEDNGIGIAPEHQGKIFEIFHRLEPENSADGEGLGLTIITRMLDRNDGAIRVESELGKGSGFFVSLPAANA